MKICRNCKTLFETRACKVCAKVCSDRWKAANPEKIRIYQEKYLRINSQRLNAARRDKYAENPEKYKNRSSAWYSKNPEKVKEWNEKWRLSNKNLVKITKANYRLKNLEKEKVRQIKWASENPKKIVASRIKYYLSHKDKLKIYRVKWKAENYETVRIQTHNYRAKKRINGGVLSRNLSKKLFILQNSKCACCYQSLDDYHLDHIIPVSLGGGNTDDNIQLLCPTCNLNKHT